MGSLKTNTDFGEFAPRDLTNCHNIYAILHKNTLYVESVEANLSLAVVVNRFVENKIEQEIKGFPGARPSPKVIEGIRENFRGKKEVVKDERGYWHLQESGGGIKAALQVMYDTTTGYIHVISRSFSPAIRAKNAEGDLQRKLAAAIVKWISSRYETPEDSLSLVGGPVPFQDYEVHQVDEFPGIYDISKRMGLDINLDNVPKILLVNFNNQDMKRMVEQQLGEVSDGFTSRQHAFHYDEVRKVQQLTPTGVKEVEELVSVVRVEPPFIVINSVKKNIPSILRRILEVVINDKYDENIKDVSIDDEALKEAQVEYFQDNVKLQMDIGQEFEQIMYNECKFGILNDGTPTTEWMENVIDSYGVDRSNGDLMAFAKIFLIYRSMYSPSSDKAVYNKIYYYAVKAQNGAPIENEQFFNQLFARSGSHEDGDHHYDILSSYYCFPEEVLQLFGYESVGDQKIYDTNTRSLTSSPLYAADRILNPKADIDQDYQSSESGVNEIVSDLVRRQFGEFINNLDTQAVVRSMSSFPMVYAEAREMFEDRGLPYRDINVALVFQPESPDVMGGYLPAAAAGSHETRQLGNFDPPIIMLNIYNRTFRTMDRVAEVLIHEVSHFIDDTMVTEGLADPAIMFNPNSPDASSVKDLIRYLKEYLSDSPTEFKAHAMEPYSHLKMADAEYLKTHRFETKKMLLREVFMSISDASFPLAADAPKGGVEISVSPGNVSEVDGKQLDLVENGRDHETYYATGDRDFDTVHVTSGDAETGVLNLARPLDYDYTASNGARLLIPVADPIELRHQREVLYSKIIDHAFDLALAVSLPD